MEDLVCDEDDEGVTLEVETFDDLRGGSERAWTKTLVSSYGCMLQRSILTGDGIRVLVTHCKPAQKKDRRREHGSLRRAAAVGECVASPGFGASSYS